MESRYITLIVIASVALVVSMGLLAVKGGVFVQDNPSVDGSIDADVASFAELDLIRDDPKVMETKTLSDGSKLTKRTNRSWTIEKGTTVFNITSTADIHEIPDIAQTKEWEYKNIRKTETETLRSNKPIMVYGDYVCADEPKIIGSGLNQRTIYADCVYYPPSVNRSAIQLLSDYSTQVNIFGNYDPLTTNLTVGLQGCWGFDNLTNGNFTDDSLHNRDLSLQGSSTTFNSTGFKVGSGNFYVNGSSGNWAQNTDWGIISGNTARTMILWFKQDTISRGAWVSWGAGSSNQLSQLGEFNDNIGYLGFANDLSTSDNPYEDGAWHWMAVTFNGSNRTLWIDNTFIKSDITTLNTGTSNINFGRSITNGEYSEIYLDEAMIWNRALNSSEMTEIYNSGSGTTCATVIDSGEAAAPEEDSCSPSSPLTANHIFDASDNCVLSSTLNANNFNVSCIGTGSLLITSTGKITNHDAFINHNCDYSCYNSGGCVE